MAGSLKVLVQLGPNCDPNKPTTQLTLSGAAEPNGGDHYANISWPSPHCITYSMEVGENEYVPAPSAFLFTSAGETYTILATSGCDPANLGDLSIQYYVHAVYAPAWADLHDVASIALDIVEPDYCCDLPAVPSGTLKTIPINGAAAGTAGGFIDSEGVIDATGVDGLTMYAGYHVGHPEVACFGVRGTNVSDGGSKTYIFTMNPGSYKWYENPFNGSGTFSSSANGSGSVSISITKPAMSNICTAILTGGVTSAAVIGPTPTSLGEVCAEELGGCSIAEVDVTQRIKFASFELLCSTKKLSLYGNSVGQGYATNRPPNPLLCCLCIGTDDNIKDGWQSTHVLSAIEIVVE